MTALDGPVSAALLHDLRAPLGHVIGFSELLLESSEDLGGLSTRWHQALHAVIASTHRITLRLNGVLSESGGAAASLVALSQALRPLLADTATLVDELTRLEEASRAELSGDVANIERGLRRFSALLHLDAPEDRTPLPAEHKPDRRRDGVVLVVDDDPQSRDLLARIMERIGLETHFAASGDAALSATCQHDFALILLDVQMPGLNGYEVLVMLQQEPRTRTVPVLVMSATDDARSVARFVELGAVDYLPKPFNLVLLRARISSCLETTRLRAQEQAIQRARTRLLATISHDLRQPLQAVRLYADALKPWLELPWPLNLLDRLQQASRSAVEMLDQFSDLSAIEEGVLRSSIEPVDLRTAIQRLCEQLRPTAEADHLQLRFRGSQAWVLTDRTQITRIVQNLVGNAIRHTARGSASSRPGVLVCIRRVGGGVAVDVVDNGPGIPQSRFGDIFEPYVQIKGAEELIGGRGLGLAIVAGLAAKLGLVVAPVRSSVGSGSRFRIVVPPDKLTTGPSNPVRESPEQLAEDWFDGRLIGVLDDDPMTLESLVAALRSRGAVCFGARTAVQFELALDAEMRFPDAVVLDLDLGSDVDGLGFLGALRGRLEYDVPAVLITGRSHPPAELPMSCSVLQKPVTLEQLALSLRGLHSTPGGVAL